MAEHDSDDVDNGIANDAAGADGVICLLCGPSGDAFSHVLASRYPVQHVGDTPIDAAVEELNRWVAQRDTGLCLVCHSQGPTPAESVVELVDTLTINPQADIAVPVTEADGLWSALPAHAACRAGRPDLNAALAFRLSCWAEQGPFAGHPHTLWEWVLRATAAGCSLAAVPVPGNVPTASWPELAPARPSSDWDWLMRRLRTEDLTGSGQAADASAAWRAGLLQVHDFLDESHECAQAIEGRGRFHDGDYWHAIMHRREPDFSNSKYWFRRVGRHPVFDRLGPQVDALLAEAACPSAAQWRAPLCGSGWDPLAFVDLCQEALSSDDQDLMAVAQQVQQTEMQLLLEHCWLGSSGG